MSIREPAADWYGVLRMEYVRCRGVVDNDGILEISADLREVLCKVSPGVHQATELESYLDVVSLMIVTAFPEKPVVYNAVDI
jgi:hypothetical protein